MRYDDPEGDTGRQKRQRIVIEELVKKLMTFNSVTNFEQLLNAVSKKRENGLANWTSDGP